MNIAFCIDNKYVPYCVITICSICENNIGSAINIFILNRNVSDENKELIYSFIKKYDFCKITFIEVSISKTQNFPINAQFQANQYITVETYFRLYLAELLPPDIEKVLYLDSDLIVCDSLETLWNTDISSVAIAAVRDNAYYSVDEYNRLRYEPKYGYFNAGVLLINIAYWREHNSLDKFFDFINTYPERLKKHDQDVLNYVFFNEKKWLPLKYNLLVGFVCKSIPFPYLEWNEIFEARKNPAIIHFSDKVKPWHEGCLHPYCYIYYKYKKLTPFADLPLEKKSLTKKQKIRHFLSLLKLCKDNDIRPDFYDHSIMLEK